MKDEIIRVINEIEPQLWLKTSFNISIKGWTSGEIQEETIF